MSTSDFNLKRNELIESSLRKIGAIHEDSAPSPFQIKQSILALNAIIRQEDGKGTAQARHLWAMSEASIQLQVGGYVYSKDDGLSSNIRELVSAVYRNSSGDDVPLDMISGQEYEELVDKNNTGDPEKVMFKKDKALDCQLLYVWPTPTSVATPSQVVGSDGENYFCTMSHTAAAINKPVTVTGNSWRLYWQFGGTTGTTWVSGTAYTGCEVIRYRYKRPLYDFDNSTDNPDMPQIWTRFLSLKLAADLAPEYGLMLDERQWLEGQAARAYDEIFPSTREDTTNYHNKTVYF